MSDVYDPVTAAQPGYRDYPCGHCRWFHAGYAVRVEDGGMTWTVWPLDMMPTGARTDAHICGACLKQVVDSATLFVNGMRIPVTMKNPVVERLGKRSSMRRLLARLKAK